jgi:hypothetical protein
MSNQTKDAARERAKRNAWNEAWTSHGHTPPDEIPFTWSDPFEYGYDAALARTCKWTQEVRNGPPITECDRRIIWEDGDTPKFCPNCGGRVQEESNEK